MDFADDRKLTINGRRLRLDRGGRQLDHAGASELPEVRHTGPWRRLGEDRGHGGQAQLLRAPHAVRPGRITGEGEIGTGGQHASQITLKGVDVPVTMLVALAWQPSLSRLGGHRLTYSGDDAGGTAQGNGRAHARKFNVLPWLGRSR